MIYSGEHNAIGGTGTGESNLIAGNMSDGFLVQPWTKDNTIIGNAIFDNGGLGINLVVEGEASSAVTPNDDGDSDTGANNLQNYPIVTKTEVTPTSLTIQGTLNS